VIRANAAMSRHRPGGSGRGVRVAEQVHKELAELIRSEVDDPRVGMVTLTGVELTRDYAYATVHFTVLPDDPQTVADTLAGLRRAGGFLRGQLGRRVRIHTTPELRFVHDTSTAHGMQMSRLIDEAVAQRADDEPAGEGHDPDSEADRGHGDAGRGERGGRTDGR